MLEILYLFNNTLELSNNNRQLVRNNDQQLKCGNYNIASNGSITITKDVSLLLMTLRESRSHSATFCEGLHE
ncbi:hypothetical protein L873DRAFT_433739 [Choiromyces venosus 120613-1]|uniref:DUF7881 domain-containing protein n=1 Tax=Choiromyces venosus 120613-1 TaxID=1336337 RepID=A0A3N4IWY3_9PEZI|nr:hypothetical protein L873DRAFT_433739 [Choiromyces venosus 120613-1]